MAKPTKSKPGNSIYLHVGVWYDAKKDTIHLTARNVKGFHTWISADPSSKRCHPNLFKKLAKCLRDQGAPAPNGK